MTDIASHKRDFFDYFKSVTGKDINDVYSEWRGNLFNHKNTLHLSYDGFRFLQKNKKLTYHEFEYRNGIEIPYKIYKRIFLNLTLPYFIKKNWLTIYPVDGKVDATLIELMLMGSIDARLV